jgi:hypothetical protein
MAKEKKQTVEVELFSGYSEQSAGLEGRDGPAERIGQNSVERHAHEARLSAFADFVTDARALSNDVVVDRFSESRINETQHRFDWSVITDHGEIIRLIIPSTVAVSIISAA